jgi:hypothetical protein
VAVSWEALRSSEISLFGSLHGEAFNLYFIYIVFITSYCKIFLFVINYCSDMFRQQFLWPSSGKNHVYRLISLMMAKNGDRNM